MSVLDGASATCAITSDTDSANMIDFQPSDCVDSIELAFSLLAPPSTLQFNFPSHQECCSSFLPASVENDAEKGREEEHDETDEAEADEADAEWRALKNNILEASWLNSAKGNGAQKAVFEAAELCVHFCEGVEYILLLRKTRARTKTQELRQELKNLRARNKIVVEEKVRMQKEMETARKVRGLDPAARAKKERENALMLEAQECVSKMEIEFQRLTEQLMEIKTNHLYLQQAQAKLLMNKQRLEEEMGEAKKNLESALGAQEYMQQIADEEKQRRTAKAKRFVQRLLYRKLACSFDSFTNRVLEFRRQREKCRRVVLKMQKRVLARAFGMFIVEVKDQQEAKQHITETQRVLDLTREVLCREVKELHLMGNKFEADIANFEKVLRDQQDVHAYDSVVQSKDKKTICKRAIRRKLQTHLAVVFDCFCVAIHLRVAHRTTVTKTISRTLKEVFERWFEYFDYEQKCVGEERLVEDKQCRIEQAKRMYKAWHWWDMYLKVVRRLQGQSVMSEVAKTEKEELNRAVECEKQRRTEQAKRIVQRELAHQRWLRAQTKKVASYRRSAQKGKVGGMLPVPLETVPLDSRLRDLSLPPSLTPASPRSLYRDLSLSLSLSPRSLSLTLRDLARERDSESDKSTVSFSHERAKERAR